MKDSKISLTLILTSIIIIMGIYIATLSNRLFLAEKQYDSLIENTNKLVENLTNKFESLEENSMIKQILAQLDTLTKENKALKSLLTEKEGPDCTVEKPTQPLKRGNRGFVIKDGELTQK